MLNHSFKIATLAVGILKNINLSVSWNVISNFFQNKKNKERFGKVIFSAYCIFSRVVI